MCLYCALVPIYSLLTLFFWVLFFCLHFVNPYILRLKIGQPTTYNKIYVVYQCAYIN